MSNYELEEKAKLIWEMYQKGLDYQNSIGLRRKIPQYVDFFEGNQWPAPTEATKNLPRPVINIIKMICRNKKAMLLSTPVRIIYKSDSTDTNVEAFNRFSEYIMKELGQELIDKNAVDDGVKKGSYFYHYYWDTEADGKSGDTPGGVRCELIDPLNIFFENPCELDEQKQQWIIVASRENVDSLKAKADNDVDKEKIVPDSMDNNAYNTKEQDENKLCTVLTRYFKVNGEVFCEKAVKTTIINKQFPILPDVDSAQREIERALNGTNEDVANNSLPDDTTKDKEKPRKNQLYPIVAGYYEKRERCIYGLGEVEGLIPNQKAINFHIAMSLLNAQENAWGKYIVLPNALKGQKISNAPGQVLVDYSGTGDGIKKMSEQAVHNVSLDIVNVITSMTRSVTGATEIMSGETIGSNMSGAAIAQLQAQAQTPIEELRSTFWLVKRKQGEVLAQFFKNFYYQKEYTYLSVEDEGEKEIHERFTSRNYRDINFSVVVEATQGTRSSAASDINMLDNLLKIGKIDIETYIKAYPESAIGNKSEILRILKYSKEGEIQALNMQITKLTEENENLQALIQKLQAFVDKVVPLFRENEKLRGLLAELYQEAEQKIAEANAIIQKKDAMLKKVTIDAGELGDAFLKSQATKEEITPDINALELDGDEL